MSSTAASPSFPPPRVQPHALHAFGGIWRLTVRRMMTLSHALILGGILLGLGLLAGASQPGNGTKDFTAWVASFYLSFLVPIVAFISAGGLLRDDLKAGTVDYIFTRPIARPRFVVFRYLAHVVCTQIDFLFAFGLLVGFGIFSRVPDFTAAIPLLLLAQVLSITVYSAFGFLCAMLTSRYVIVGLAYGALIELGMGNMPTQLNRLSMLRHLTNVFRPVVDLRFGMHGPMQAELLSPTVSVLVLLGLSVAMVGVAALLLGRREPGGAVGREP